MRSSVFMRCGAPAPNAVRLVLAAAALALCSASAVSSAAAQIIRAPRRPPEPRGWVSGSIGFLQPWDVEDGTTHTAWEFGNSVQYRVSLEMPVQYGSTVGVTATLARVPLTYVPLTGSTQTVCFTSCDADANVWQVLGSFHAGGSAIGFHQVIELSAGATMYSNFRERTSGQRLVPMTTDVDFSIAIGYGFGYTMSPGVQLNLVQDLGLTVHQRTNLAGGADALARQYTTRLGVRLGLGL